MIEWVLAILWYVFVAIATGMFVVFMAFVGFCFWTSYVWNEYMKRDDNNLKEKDI